MKFLKFQVRAKVMGGVICYAWFAVFLSIAAYTPISTTWGVHTSFFIFGAINLAGSIFVFIFLPETKGKNDEEIRHILSKSSKVGLDNK